MGASVVVGAGVADFIDASTRDATTTAGTWELRATYGTQSVFGVEAAYVGSWQAIDALGLDDQAVLLGSAAETALRFNFVHIPHIQPFAVLGCGMSWYNVVNESFNQSNVDDTETGVYVPLGVGLALTANRFVLEVRGVYRPMTSDDLIEHPDEVGASLDLDSWSATAHVGVEF